MRACALAVGGAQATTRANIRVGLGFVPKSKTRSYRFSRQRHSPSVTGTENYDDIISKKLLTGGEGITGNKKPRVKRGHFILMYLISKQLILARMPKQVFRQVLLQEHE